MNVKLYTHKPEGKKVRSHLVELELEDDDARTVASAFFNNPTGLTSVHEETAQALGLLE